MTEPQNTQSFSAQAEETTPLLSTGGEQSIVPQGQSSAESGPLVSSTSVFNINARTIQILKILTYISLISSATCLLLLIGMYTAFAIGPRQLHWYLDVDRTIIGLGVTILFPIIISTINLRRLYVSMNANALSPLLLNLIFDVLVVISTWILASILFGKSFKDPCGVYPQPLRCERWRLALRVLGTGSAGLAVVTGFTHLLLFVLRFAIGLRTGFWTGSHPWAFAAGQFSVEFKVKVLRQEREREE